MDLRAVIFVPALAGAVICGFVFLLFAVALLPHGPRKHRGRGEGSDLDQRADPRQLLEALVHRWLFGLWLGPAYLIGRTLAGSDVGLAEARGAAARRRGSATRSVSCRRSSRQYVWMPLYPHVFARLAQKPGVTLGFFVLSLPVLALFGGRVPVGVPHDGRVGAAVRRGAAAWWSRGSSTRGSRPARVRAAVHQRPVPREEEEETEGARSNRRRDRRRAGADGAAQPSDLPPINTADGELAGYNVLIADDPPRRRSG